MAEAAVNVAEGFQGQVVTVNVAALPIRDVVELISLSGRKIGISPWVIGAVALGVTALLLKKTDRRKTAAFVVGTFIEAVCNQLAADAAQEQRGIESLRDVILPAPTRPTIAIALARQNDPLLATETHELIQAHFPDEPVVGGQPLPHRATRVEHSGRRSEGVSGEAIAQYAAGAVTVTVDLASTVTVIPFG
ncbi:hypothetical protein ACFWIZ_02165 [Streptomyces sp. NPDC127044]